MSSEEWLRGGVVRSGKCVNCGFRSIDGGYFGGSSIGGEKEADFTKVPHMSLVAPGDLEVEDEAVRCFLEEALEWTRNPMKYEALLEGVSVEGERVSPLNDAMMKALLEAKCSAVGKVRSEVSPFGVAELKVKEDLMYHRRRPIFEPTINKLIKSITPIKLTALGENVRGGSS